MVRPLLFGSACSFAQIARRIKETGASCGSTFVNCQGVGFPFQIIRLFFLLGSLSRHTVGGSSDWRLIGRAKNSVSWWICNRLSQIRLRHCCVCPLGTIACISFVTFCLFCFCFDLNLLVFSPFLNTSPPPLSSSSSPPPHSSSSFSTVFPSVVTVTTQCLWVVRLAPHCKS